MIACPSTADIERTCRNVREYQSPALYTRHAGPLNSAEMWKPPAAACPFSATLRCCPACVGNLPAHILGRLGPTARRPFLFGLPQEVDMMAPTSTRSSILVNGAVFTSRRIVTMAIHKFHVRHRFA